MTRLRKVKKLLLGAVAHVILFWGFLAIVYNSYKEVAYLSRAARSSIKDTFPLSVVIFLTLYLIVSLVRDKKEYCLSIKEYGVIIALYAVITNTLNYSKEMHILIVQNGTVLLFILVLLVWGCVGTKMFIPKHINVSVKDFLPPILYIPLQRYVSVAKDTLVAHYKKDRSRLFMASFMLFFLISVILLILKAGRAAEHAADFAYCSLVAGVGIELYKMIRYRERDEEE